MAESDKPGSLKECIYNAMVAEVRTLLTSERTSQSLKPYTEKQIAKFLEDKADDIDMAVEDLFKAYRKKDDLSKVRTGLSATEYRKYLFVYITF